MSVRAYPDNMSHGRRWIVSARQLWVVLAVVLAAYAFGFGSVSHAMEPTRCPIVAQTSLGNAGNGHQKVPGSDKGFAHHHGGCHGHQLGQPATSDKAQPVFTTSVIIRHDVANLVALTTTDPGLRPPIA